MGTHTCELPRPTLIYGRTRAVHKKLLSEVEIVRSGFKDLTQQRAAIHI